MMCIHFEKPRTDPESTQCEAGYTNCSLNESCPGYIPCDSLTRPVFNLPMAVFTDLCVELEQAKAELLRLKTHNAEWVESETTYAGADRKNMTCSKCGGGITVGRDCPQEKLYPYCPFCGAKMQGANR